MRWYGALPYCRGLPVTTGSQKRPSSYARLPGQMVLHHLPLTSARSRCEREQASPGNLEDVWPCLAVLDRLSTPCPTPSDWLPRPLLSWSPPLDTSAGIWDTQHSSISRGHCHMLYNHYGIMPYYTTFLKLDCTKKDYFYLILFLMKVQRN